jgi:hypothetical protein
MIAAILAIILITPTGAEKAVPVKQYDSIVSCERAIKANTKAMALQTGWKVKSMTCTVAG